MVSLKTFIRSSWSVHRCARGSCPSYFSTNPTIKPHCTHEPVTNTRRSNIDQVGVGNDLSRVTTNSAHLNTKDSRATGCWRLRNNSLRLWQRSARRWQTEDSTYPMANSRRFSTRVELFAPYQTHGPIYEVCPPSSHRSYESPHRS
jgi:hypothetical protein